MKNILIALSSAIIFIFACFFVATFLGFTKEIASTISGSMAVVFIAIHQTIEKRENKDVSSMQKDIVKIELFGFPWQLMIIYGTALTYTISSIGGLTSGAIGGSVGLPIEYSLKVSICYMLFFQALGFYFVGRWIGIKCLTKGILVIILIGLLHSVISNSLNFSFASDRAFSVFLGQRVRSLLFLLVVILGGWVLNVPLLAVGYWRGRQIRQIAYFQYLLNLVPNESKNTILELAHDEACILLKNE